MGLQEFYEESYQRDRMRSSRELLEEVLTSSKGLFHFVVEIKNKFLQEVDWSGLSVLELGAGRGGVGLHLARLGADVTLMDFSPSALAQAEQLYALDGKSVKTITADVTHPDVNPGKKFDLIVDSHLLHCLTEDPDRSSYYRLISDCLSDRGVLAVETMVHRKKLYIPDGFMFDERNVLWQMFGEWKPVRRILDSLDLEKELNEAQFAIIYFYYYASYGFVPHESFLEIPAEILPAAVRFVVKNKAL